MEKNNSNKRGRDRNWTWEEKEFLKEVLTPYVHIVDSKINNTNMIVKKNNAWKEISEEMERNGVFATIPKLKAQWMRMKTSARSNILNFKREANATGGGKEPKEPDELDYAIQELLPMDFEEDMAEFDSDAHYGAAVKGSTGAGRGVAARNGAAMDEAISSGGALGRSTGGQNVAAISAGEKNADDRSVIVGGASVEDDSTFCDGSVSDYGAGASSSGKAVCRKSASKQGNQKKAVSSADVLKKRLIQIEMEIEHQKVLFEIEKEIKNKKLELINMQIFDEQTK